MQQGFVLTRQSRDLADSTEITLWLSTESGPAKVVVDGEQPVFFVFADDFSQISSVFSSHKVRHTFKSLTLKTFDHQAIYSCYFLTNKEKIQATQLLDNQEIHYFESDIRLPDRYLMERFVCGGVNFIGQPTAKKGFTEYRKAKVKAGDYIPALSVVSLDIECSEKGILYSVGLHSDRDSRVIMIGEPQEESELHIEWVADEKALLLALERWFTEFDPDVVIGWSVIDFDFRLLVKRAQWHQLPFRIGRGNSTPFWRQSNKNSRQGFISIPGRVVLDGIDSLKTATYNFNSWSLESVSQELLNEGKDIHNVHDRMDEINRMFREDKCALAKYNLQDCVLVTRIFEHTHLLEFLIERTRLTGVELDRVGGSVAAFTNLYLPRLHRAGYIAPNLESENWIASPGGYVMESKPGLYDSVLVLDFKSLYPSIIRSFLIDPMGLVEGLKLDQGRESYQAVAGFRGGQFHREKHFLPKLIEDLWAARDQAKRNGEKAFSQAIKIIMNSFYGVLGSSGCRFFDHRLASSITMRGHEVLGKTKDMIEVEGYEVIYGDTDSVFVSLGASKTQQEADVIGLQLVESINQQWTDNLRNEFGLDNHLELEYETHYHKFLMPTIRGSEMGSKKRYAGLVVYGDQESMVFKGLETVRTDWTALAQQFQKTLYHMVFHDQNPDDYIRDYVNKTLAGEHDDLLIYRKRLRRNLSDYQKNIPPQVRAARLADEMNHKLGRPLQYQRKATIEYVFTLSGAEPREYRQSAIDYNHYLDKQLKPVADGILPFIGKYFDDITAPQLGLF